jgi:ABC-type transport system involved in multi-copper enzyme maturation permease subunit
VNTVTRRLIAKDLYLQRGLIALSIVAGLASLAIAAEGAMRFNIGALAWITTVVALGIMVALRGVVNERKERSELFVLSLPISHGDHVRIKQIALLACYLPGWLVLSGGAIALYYVMPNLPDGMIPYLVLLCGFLLASFTVVLCGALHARSEGAMTSIIVLTNMGVSVFMFTVGAIPSIYRHLRDAQPVWNQTFWIVLVVELAVCALALSLPHFVAARRRDHH